VVVTHEPKLVIIKKSIEDKTLEDAMFMNDVFTLIFFPIKTIRKKLVYTKKETEEKPRKISEIHITKRGRINETGFFKYAPQKRARPATGAILGGCGRMRDKDTAIIIHINGTIL